MSRWWLSPGLKSKPIKQRASLAQPSRFITCFTPQSCKWGTSLRRNLALSPKYMMLQFRIQCSWGAMLFETVSKFRWEVEQTLCRGTDKIIEPNSMASVTSELYRPSRSLRQDEFMFPECLLPTVKHDFSFIPVCSILLRNFTIYIYDKQVYTFSRNFLCREKMWVKNIAEIKSCNWRYRLVCHIYIVKHDSREILWWSVQQYGSTLHLISAPHGRITTREYAALTVQWWFERRTWRWLQRALCHIWAVLSHYQAAVARSV
jgi:hypothetical protein